MRSRVYKRGNATIGANLTPMIDMSFLLIVFFVIVSRVGDRHYVPLDLPRPVSPSSSPLEEIERTTVNVLPRDDQPSVIASVRSGDREFAPDRDGREALSRHLAALYRVAPETRLNLRADRRIEYRFIEPILRAVSDAAARAGAVPRVNLVIVREQ